MNYIEDVKKYINFDVKPEFLQLVNLILIHWDIDPKDYRGNEEHYVIEAMVEAQIACA
jgi:hypothetical protein